jgi:hypothetical protein
MALVLGTNCGFVPTSPTDDPAGINITCDAIAQAIKHTTPVGVTKITEVGWWCDNATQASNFEVGLYSNDADTNKPNTRLYVSNTNAKGTDSGWKKVTVDWTVTPETVYWITFQLDNTVTTSRTNYYGSAGDRISWYAVDTLENPWGASSESEYLYSIYALYESTTYVDIAGTITGTSSLSGAITIDNVVLISGVVTGTSAVGGALGAELILSPDWQTDTFKNIKRLVIAGNDSIWYEDI